MKTIGQWLQELPEGYRQSAIAQSDNDRDCPVDSLKDAVQGFTDWERTTEGSDFWADTSIGIGFKQLPNYYSSCLSNKVDLPKEFEKYAIGKALSVINGIIFQCCVRQKNGPLYIAYFRSNKGGAYSIDIDFSKGFLGGIEGLFVVDNDKGVPMKIRIEERICGPNQPMPDDRNKDDGRVTPDQVIDEIEAKLNNIERELSQVFMNDCCYFNYSSGWVSDLKRTIELYRWQK